MLALHKCQPWEGSWEQDDNGDSIFWDVHEIIKPFLCKS